MTTPDIKHLRAHAISHTLFAPTSLKAAINRLGFVQADPIRSPARAQDLILRHRVRSYRAGDLERRYESLDIEEDVLYAYGFMPRQVWRLLHPRDSKRLPELTKKVFDTVCKLGETHPAELEAHFGRDRVINAWGGYSKATTRALESLHHHGLLRICRRENGIRIYQPTPKVDGPIYPPAERLRKLILLITNILAPIPLKTLNSRIARYRRLGNPRAELKQLLHSGQLEQQTIDGLDYIWPAQKKSIEDPPSVVRFLAPFDPLVWDRLRFEHLWKWPYRFEAYTPPAKRVRGYYAMPMLWRDHIIGWANARVIDGDLDIELGFIDKRPRERIFQNELEVEIVRLRDFLAINRLLGNKS